VELPADLFAFEANPAAPVVASVAAPVVSSVAAPNPSLNRAFNSPLNPAALAHGAAPESLHPALWRAHQLGRPGHAVWASGFAPLDQQLPGAGWPAGALTELLLPHPGVGELRLLAPVLVALQKQQRNVMWFDPPAAPCPWALGALGLDMQRQLIVRTQPSCLQPPCLQRPGAGLQRGRSLASARSGGAQAQPAADLLWALEQALKSGHLGAVLAWLPARLPADALRRLQLAAQAHEGPVFLLRDAEQRSRPSPAPLRLLLSAWGPDLLRVSFLKRRGPPLAQPLMLELPAVLSAPALARALRGVAPGAAVSAQQAARAVAVAAVAAGRPQPLAL
jgi:protein ImuA